MSTITYDKERILKYWCRYFPEITQEELDNIVQFMGDTDYETLSREYEQYDDFDKNEIEEFADFEYCEIIDKYKEWFHGQQMFTSFILPIVNKQMKQVLNPYDKNELFYNHEEFWKNMINDINFQVYQNLYKSIIFEISYLKKENCLIGKTSEERMQYFQNEYAQDSDNVRKFYQEYYAITMLTAYVVKSEFTFIKEVLAHIEEHKNELEEQFQVRIEKGCIERIHLGKGDIHQGGKSVAMIELVNQVKFLYKPHELTLDKKFSERMEWLNAEIPEIHNYVAPAIVTTKKYGFSEFVKHCECKDREEVKRFYERIGELLAVLYSLNSSDFHYENIIACGEYPVLIDLETLVHPCLANAEDEESNGAYANAEKKYNRSVATIGMLPTYMKGNLEVGGLGAEKEQNSTFKTEFVEAADSDFIHIVRKHFKITPEQNNPVVNGKAEDSAKYIPQIEKGFTTVYKWICNHPSEYIEVITNLFTGCTGRLVIRPTLYYSQLLNISVHQEFTRKINERKFILYRIAEERYQEYPDVVRAEFTDLMNGNIPYFTYEIGKCEVFRYDGKALEKSRIVSILDEIKEKVMGFGDRDLKEQLQYIQDSYITRKNQADRTGIAWNCYKNELESEKWIATAVSIGEYIAENAVTGMNARKNEEYSWICVTLQGFEEDVWIPSVLGHEFYSGNAGIAFYFIYLWKLTKKKCFLESAKKAAEIPITLLESKYVNQNSSLGAFTGIGGTLYMLNALAEESQDARLKKKVEDTMISYTDFIVHDQSNDIIGGSAGYLAVALKLAKTSERKEEFRNVIVTIVGQLMRNVIITGEKAFWDCLKGKHYCGFSHGNAGIHTYLYLAMKYLGEDIAQSITEKSLTYERTCFSKTENNWWRSDLEQTVSNAWCHGAPGILLSKLLLYDAGLQDNKIKKEIEVSLNGTRQYGFGNNPTYCHGDLGNAAIINLAGKILNRPELCNQNMHVFQQLYSGVLSKNWNNKNMKSCNTYGLMVGLSGWGYAMLSHYAENNIPEFLWIE